MMIKNKLWVAASLLLASTLLAGCPPAPKLGVSTTSHHFGIDPNTQTYETVFAFQIFNNGTEGTELVFNATTNEPWISLNVPSTISTGKDDKVTITVTIDREYSEAKSAGIGFATGEIEISSSVGEATVAITTAPNYFTANVINGGGLEGLALTFTESNGPSFYEETKTEITGFPTDISGLDTYGLDFGLFGDPIRAGLFGNATVPFYGMDYSELFISSDGWVSFGEPGNSPSTLGAHFAVPQISLLPVDATAPGAKVSYLQEADKLVITFENVPTAGAPGFGNNFQLELFFDGTIQISYLDVDPVISGIVGLSVGNGLNGIPPTDFLESDLINVNTGSLKSL